MATPSGVKTTFKKFTDRIQNMNTSTLAISGIIIRQDSHGRYLLNDLHKAAGSERRHEPSFWRELQQTQELIEFLIAENQENSDTGIPVSEQNQPLRVVKGGNGIQGTFAVKELVYAYATWISARFFLTVIRAYDAMVNNKPPYGLKEIPHQSYCPTTLTEKMCDHVQVRINELARNEGVHYNTKYRELKDVFNANSYTRIPVTKYADVCQWLGCEPIYPIPDFLMIEGTEFKAIRDAAYFELPQVKAQLESTTVEYLEHKRTHDLAVRLVDDMRERTSKTLAQAQFQVDCEVEQLYNNLKKSRKALDNAMKTLDDYYDNAPIGRLRA